MAHDIHVTGEPGGGQRPVPPRRSRRRAGLLVTALIGVIAVGLAGLLVRPVHQDSAALAARFGVGPWSLGQRAGLGPPTAVQAAAYGGTPAVGALFTTTNGRLRSHFCTASVVDSPHGDLIVTAAHCTSAFTVGHVVFVPAYHDGKAPFGIWAVTRVVADENWSRSADPNDDVAFLRVSQRGRGPIESVTGGERLGLGMTRVAGLTVRVPAYPGGAASPITCENDVRLFTPTQLEFDCGGYTDGTSGSPLLADVNPATGRGTVIGVIGGYEQGGYTPEVSYAARFGGNIAALYKAAAQF